MDKETKCGFVTIIGAPNAGKSTLVNQLVGAKVSIVTHKVQTTRARLRGIAICGPSQIVLTDTPGIFAPRRRLDRAMVETAWASAMDADIVALLVDVSRQDDGNLQRVLDRLDRISLPKLLVLNKVDRCRKEALLAQSAELNAQTSFERTFMVSALNGDGLEDLRDYLADAMPPGPWHFPQDQIADAPMRHTAAEITREKLYLRLHDELPYASTVETTDWKTQPDGSARIEQTIFVERESQRKIILGKKGQTIKSISMDARKELAEMIGAKVHLFLFVKVRDGWGDDPERYREMGLDFPT